MTSSDAALAPHLPTLHAAGLEPRELLGVGSFSVVVAADHARWGPCAVKVPWFQEPRRIPGIGPWTWGQVSPTGPFDLITVSGQQEAEALLRDSCELMTLRGSGPPLARLYEVLEPGPVAVLARVDSPRWTPERPGAITRLARAVLTLHESFGPHGDLKPEHIHDGGAQVTLLDPLPETWDMGSIGFSWPEPGAVDRAAGRGRWRDVQSVAAVLTAGLGGSLGWGPMWIYGLLNAHNGRFGDPVGRIGLLADACNGTLTLPADLRAWVLRVVEVSLDGENPEPRAWLEALAEIGRGR